LADAYRGVSEADVRGLKFTPRYGGDLKSNVSDHLEMARIIYIDACAKCIADVSDLRDIETMISRVENEGISFLTITLPKFCEDFERSLANGKIDSSLFRNFRKSGAIPAFLQGMLSLIFDRETGRIYNETSFRDCSTLVDSIRQICLAFKKVELECTPERVASALQGFNAIEQSFDMSSVPEEASVAFCHVASVLWDNSLVNIDLATVIPKHGPGATAERVSGNRKYVWGLWHDRLEPYFPVLESTYCVSALESEEFEKVTIISKDQEQPVRVTPVPKTLKGPRIIAIEPSCMQYAQQAIRSVLYDVIESSELTKGHVNFRDQSVNQKLALISSKTGQLATIDLSDASDRVPRDLSLEMFHANPDLRDAIDACRSTRAELPDGSIIGPLKKFASMGSALCFPVESMYFYTICVAALLKAHDLPVTYANCFYVSRDVYVYGDDIVVPSTYASTVLDYLQKYNCKVNNSKTFLTGKFRESCGIDAYDGEPVTPVYLRKERPQNRRQASEIISWTATANLFYLKGYWRTAQLMYTVIERIIGSLPYVSVSKERLMEMSKDPSIFRESSALGRVSFLGYRSIERWNSSLHRFELKGWIPSPVYRSDRIDGYSALKKSLVRLETIKYRDSTDAHHLERSALHGAVVLKRRWVPAT